MMNNAYATLKEYKDFTTSRNQEPNNDTADDGVIEFLLEAASRLIDQQTQRRFYPIIAARLYDAPNDRELWLDDDLLEVVALLSGETSIANTEYYLLQRNISPHYAIKLSDVTSNTWNSNAFGSVEGSISVTGVWGFHDRYKSAWETVAETDAQIDESETVVAVTDGSRFSAGDLIRIEDEIMFVARIAGERLTVERGYNESTAASHDTANAVRVWRVMPSIKSACLEIANTAYNRRFGRSFSTTETITSAGVVLTPNDIPTSAALVIGVYGDKA
jgi:hypothetical protein